MLTTISSLTHGPTTLDVCNQTLSYNIIHCATPAMHYTLVMTYPSRPTPALALALVQVQTRYHTFLLLLLLLLLLSTFLRVPTPIPTHEFKLLLLLSSWM